MKTVVIGLLGTSLDAGKGPGRWEKWRPSVDLCRHDDLLIDRFELLREAKWDSVAQRVAEDIHSISPETKVRQHEISFKDPWDFEEVYGVLHDFARGYEFDTENEQYLIHIVTGTHVAQICMYLLTETRYFPARLLQSSPPRKQRKDNVGSYSMIDLDLSRYDQIASRFEREQKEGLSFLKSGIDTRNKKFNLLIEEIEEVAIRSREPILLMGPTGAGKSQLARKIYDLKKSRNQVEGSFVEVNCATLRGDAAMSTLFGHVKGSFTGALKDRTGLLRTADRGMLFLDEIGELGLDEQAMLLRALEEKVFLPVGSDQESKSDFILIAGTNRDLSKEVHAGRFRDDLLSRINLWTFRLPGLAERKEDIEPNLAYELDQFALKKGTHVTFNKEARTKFLEFAVGSEGKWKGNFRDLNAAVTRMATLAPGGRVNVESVKLEVDRLKSFWEEVSGEENEILLATLGLERVEGMDPFDRVQLAEVLRVCRESANLSEAGRKLFSESRKRKKHSNDADRLRKYLMKFDLSWHDVGVRERGMEE